MKVSEWEKKHPGIGCMTELAGNAPGGFGKKGWSAYGNISNCDIINITWRTAHGKLVPVLHVWYTKLWGPCPEP